MIIQDDSLKLVGDELTTEPYGGGFKKGDTAFEEFLNGVLDEYKADGGWQKSYDKWLGQYTGEEQEPPTQTLEEVARGASDRRAAPCSRSSPRTSTSSPPGSGSRPGSSWRAS